MEDMEKEIKASLKESLNLLASWDLESLCKKFEEQEVCTEALRHLTDADIIELIPKIGPRSIFRSHLKSWRQQQDFEKQNPRLNSGNPDISTVSVKTELPEAIPKETGPEEATPEETLAENQWESYTDEEAFSKEEESCEDSDSRAMSVSKYGNLETESTIQLDVYSVLTNCHEGVSVLEYYKENNYLDMHHRKKVVKIVIAAALAKRLEMSVFDFHSMSTQIVNIFPKERADTYYIPRVGTKRARGMLYNKYVNLARSLRKEGRLEYKRNIANKSQQVCKYNANTVFPRIK